MGKRKKNKHNKKDKKQKDKELFLKWLKEHENVPDKDKGNNSLEGYKPFSKLDYDKIKKNNQTSYNNKKQSKNRENIKEEEETKSGRAFSDDDKHLFFRWLGEDDSEIKDKDENREDEDNRYKRPFSKEGKKLKKSIKPKHKNYKKFYVEDENFMEKWLNQNKDKIFDKDSEMKKDEQYMYPPDITDAFRIDSSLDLHGFKVDEALFMLKSFIKECFDRNDKVVKIIHGKGLHSTGGTSKVKKAVKDWLLREGRSYISFFKTAPKKHGGSGAVIIWLK